MAEIYHALGLHLHQPPGNMLDVLRGAQHDAIGIIHAYDRIVRYAHRYPDTARSHVGMSEILLDQLTEYLKKYPPRDIFGEVEAAVRGARS